MSTKKNRRALLRDSALLAVGASAVVVGGFPREALADVKTMSINPNATAVMPDGSIKTRAQLMKKLGFNPTTPPDAWLNIAGCGSNAAALTRLQRAALAKRGVKVQKGRMKVNTEAKAVMANGQFQTRAQVLTKLGFSPTTPPDAWLNVAGCGSNAAALTSSQRSALSKRGVRFDRVRRVR